jgi:hypothetical protein
MEVDIGEADVEAPARLPSESMNDEASNPNLTMVFNPRRSHVVEEDRRSA